MTKSYLKDEWYHAEASSKLFMDDFALRRSSRNGRRRIIHELSVFMRWVAADVRPS